jgi:hypothetical protein
VRAGDRRGLLGGASLLHVAVRTRPPLLPQLFMTYVRMFAIASSLSWFIGGITEL